MSRKKGKPVNFDTAVKIFMGNYGIPTKKDIEKINLRLDHLEQLIMKTIDHTKGFERVSGRGRRGGMTASDTVLNIVKEFKQGINFAEIQARTNYEEKKLRNIIFRLNDIGKIKRKSRGVYVIGN